MNHTLIFLTTLALTLVPAMGIANPLIPAGTQIQSPKVNELSGVIPASIAGYWGINDSGNSSSLYCFNSQGALLHEIPLKKVNNVDWEAITRDQDGYLYIGDFGDNDAQRKTYTIHKIHETHALAQKGETTKTYTFRYEDRKSRNCEAFFVQNGRLYLISKEPKESDTPSLFCIDSLQEKGPAIARRVGPMAITGRVTDVAYSSTHNLVVVLTKKQFFTFSFQQERDLLQAPQNTQSFKLGKCEGICFDGDTMILTNEKGGIWQWPLQLVTR
ncbi:MAG: hypothetical protein RBU29_12495 [bacterium]|jgi:hypothetical protein|nr:hypothetical protein [bacterium]